MKITASAVSLNVPDVPAPAAFVKEHFGFEEATAFEDKMALLTRDDVGFNLIYLQTGLETFKPKHLAGSAKEGLLVVFVVQGIDAEYERLVAEGVPVVTPIETDSRPERRHGPACRVGRGTRLKAAHGKHPGERDVQGRV